MKTVLTAKEHQQLVTVLRELDHNAIKERRRLPRRKTLINLWMQRLGKNARPKFSEILLVNVSTNSVGLLSKVACLTGEKLVLPLPFIEGGGWLVLCEVRNCQKLVCGQFKIGCRFIDKIEDENGDAKIPDQWRKNCVSTQG
ncbi:MAG: hypothetical protein FWD61_06035 [Phycisphaerales bacterium]|nr:hypothetical protein [Phycisphaerales bacterium]